MTHTTPAIKPTNVLFIICDEMSRQSLSCYGNQLVKTPNIDRLVREGSCFTQAYTPSPICVPTRASLATGQYVHQIGTWSSAEPYDGSVPGWGHQLLDKGHTVTSVGKLHYRSAEDNNGFSEEIMPMHVFRNIGWPIGLLRDQIYSYDGAPEMAQNVGAGESDYTRYDAKIAAESCRWIADAGKQQDASETAKPWVLFSSFVAPHYPLIAPQKYYDMYPPESVDMPLNYAQEERPQHPEVAAMARFWSYDDHFSEESLRKGRAAYYGLCSYLDHHVGMLIKALEDAGLYDSTRIIFTSDHGEMLGNRGLWGKSVMYEESVGIPMIISGPGIPAGQRIDTPVSLIDCHRTVLHSVLGETQQDAATHSHSLIDMANGFVPDRTLLSEYHDGGCTTGFFMIRMGDWKFTHYVGRPPQLFNLKDDPLEQNDLGGSEVHQDIRAQCMAKLREVCDPEAVNEQAFRDQQVKIDELGGKQACLEWRAFNYTPLPE
ncbi:sulfatase-like hydrolase/transferase [Aliamphritea spongicola]|uniref:sulfatase-like hydrolase/transferase n=1 Tax=Aliamphritea spongicola TaxID=707589 RepID=UPI00196AB46D|nr:sulfatase-like hydrolase/transferase [Aliamphritea spongicola]MBN3561045.1 sulfatase-like hydrolase/transferase [Aliamphritea spongicola]